MAVDARELPEPFERRRLDPVEVGEPERARQVETHDRPRVSLADQPRDLLEERASLRRARDDDLRAFLDADARVDEELGVLHDAGVPHG